MVRSTRSSVNTTRRTGDASRPLRLAIGSVVILTLLHDLDHVRQGRELPAALDLIGALATTASLALLVWVWRDGALAARAATLFGMATAIGLIAVHVIPRWSSISDPYPEAGVDALSWIGLFSLIGAACVLAAVSRGRIRPE